MSSDRRESLLSRLTAIDRSFDDETRTEYKDGSYEGTSYEYPARRLANKTREEALLYRGDLGSSGKLWVLYEFEAFHRAGIQIFNDPDMVDYNDPDKQRPLPQEGARNFLYFDGHVENL